MRKNLSYMEAFKAMSLFLEKYYEQTNSDDVAVLLGGMQLLRDEETADPAAWADWLDSIKKVQTNNE